MGQDEARSSTSRFPLFLVGQNSHGNWVVQDPKGRCGGLFIDRAEAIKFAMYESGSRPQAVIMVPGTLSWIRAAGPMPLSAHQRHSTGLPPAGCVRLLRLAASLIPAPHICRACHDHIHSSHSSTSHWRSRERSRLFSEPLGSDHRGRGGSSEARSGGIPAL